MYAVIRLRSGVNVREGVRRTMSMMNLTRINHCTIIPDTPQYAGMLRKAKDYITWGEVDADTLADMIKIRGRLVGDKPITDDYVAEHTDHESIDAFAAALVAGEAQYRDVAEVKPLFRLHPPKGGLETIKHHYTVGGSLGNRGEAINSFIRRML